MDNNDNHDKAIGRMPQNTPSVKKGKNYLLVIGIDDYTDAAIPKLRNAVKDIEKLEGILIEHYDFHLHRKLPNGLATRSAILDALESLENTLKSDDNLVIFFSGHGYRKGKHGFIVPVDGKNDSTSAYISFAELNVRLDELPMQHFLFILDCCYAGSVLKKMGDKVAFNKPSRRILAASQAEETAEDGFVGRNSPFTSALVEILATNEKEELPVKTLFSDLRELMDTKGVRQVPVEGSWKMDSNRDGEFVFAKKAVVNPEIADWETALSLDSIIGFQNFSETYPLSNNGVFAKKRIEELQKAAADKAKADAERAKAEVERSRAEVEKQAYNYAKQQKTVAALSKFLRDNRDSVHFEEIENLLAEVEREAAWKDAKRLNTLTAFLGFQRKYRTGAFAKECQERIEAFYKQLDEDEPAPLPKIEPKAATKVEPTPPPKVESKIEPTPPPKVEPKVELPLTPKVEPKIEATLTPKVEPKTVEKSTPPPVVEVEKDPSVQTVKTDISTRNIDNQVITDEPSVFQKYKMLFIVGALLLVVGVIWNIKSGGNKQQDTVIDTPMKAMDSSVSTSQKLDFEPDVVKITGGTFKMGSTDGGSDEKPIHDVTVSDFSMGKYEITVAQFKAFVADSSYKTDAEKEDGSYVMKGSSWEKKQGVNWRHDELGQVRTNLNYPVVHVSWNDAAAYCKWLSRKTSKSYRLPTEAEWEYAAGNGTKHTKYSWGNNNPTNKAGNIADETAKEKFKDWTTFDGYRDGFVYAAPVGSFSANDFGLYDMSGNVWEWCNDWYDSYSSAAQQNPKGAAKSSNRVDRGGGWGYAPTYCRTADRSGYAPTGRGSDLGFRVVLSFQ